MLFLFVISFLSLAYDMDKLKIYQAFSFEWNLSQVFCILIKSSWNLQKYGSKSD